MKEIDAPGKLSVTAPLTTVAIDKRGTKPGGVTPLVLLGALRPYYYYLYRKSNEE